MRSFFGAKPGAGTKPNAGGAAAAAAKPAAKLEADDLEIVDSDSENDANKKETADAKPSGGRFVPSRQSLFLLLVSPLSTSFLTPPSPTPPPPEGCARSPPRTTSWQ